MVAVIGGAIATGLGLGPVGAAILEVALGLGASALSSRLAAQRARESTQTGIRTQVTTAGGTRPRPLMLGRYATAGHAVAPYYAHGAPGSSQNSYRTQIIALSAHPITALKAVWVNGRKFSIPTQMDGPVHADYGMSPDPVARPFYAGNFWLKFYDGTQGVADPMLVAKYGSHPTRPWTSAHVGRGIAYVVATFKNDADVYGGRDPTLLFEVEGAKLYDWRLDSTAGGVGAQRWNIPATWTYSENPVVALYNVRRGIPLSDGTLWGYGDAAADLPTAWWTVAANRADDSVDGAPRYRFGMEIPMATPDYGGMTPAEVCDRLLDACNGEFYDESGTSLIYVDGPGLPVAAFTDDDIIEGGRDSFTPAPPLTGRFNGVRATYVSPGGKWESKEAPPRNDAVALAEDGRPLIASLSLDAVWDDKQVQRLMKAWLREARSQFRRNIVTLRPAYSRVRVGQSITWTLSDAHGYVTKRFKIVGKVEDPATLHVTLTLVETNPSDYDWTPGEALPSSAPSDEVTVWAPEVLPGLAVTAVSIEDASGTNRRPAIRIAWSPGIDHDKVVAEVRVQATLEEVIEKTTGDIARGHMRIHEGILPNVTYEVNVRGLRPRGEWSGWIPILTPNTQLAAVDIAPGGLTADRTNRGQPVNRLVGSDFQHGLRDVKKVATGTVGTQTTLLMRDEGLTYAGSDFPTLLLYQSGTAINGTTDYAEARFVRRKKGGTQSDRMTPVRAGDWIEFSVQASTHRCAGIALLYWRNAAGASLGSAQVALPDNVTSSATNPEEWPRYRVAAQAPAGAAFAQVGIRKFGTSSGADSYLFAHKPMVADTHAFATEAVPYATDGATLTDGAALIDLTVNRPSAIKGLSTDFIEEEDLPAQALTTTSTEIFLKGTVSAYPVGLARDEIMTRLISFQARAPAAGITVTVELQVRQDDFNTGYAGWATVETFTITDTAWAIYRDSARLQGPFHATQYRLLAVLSSASGTTAIKDMYFGLQMAQK